MGFYVVRLSHLRVRLIRVNCLPAARQECKKVTVVGRDTTFVIGVNQCLNVEISPFSSGAVTHTGN